jgi:hypothetical protein
MTFVLLRQGFLEHTLRAFFGPTGMSGQFAITAPETGAPDTPPYLKNAVVTLF